jgi:hypothetical protein
MSDLNYDEASKHLSPGMREFLLRVASRSGISEDDALYAVIAAHGDMLDEKLKAVHEQLAKALNGSAPNGQASHAEDVEATRAEITALAQIVRGMGESTAKLERRWTILGDGITKLETRLQTLDETTRTFKDIFHHQLWHLVALSGAAGAALAFAVQWLWGWMSATFHI